MGSVRFDRKAPGEGVEVRCRLENGKARLEWRLHFVEECESGCTVELLHLRLVDNRGNVAAECVQDVREEETLESVLLQPGLWQGVENPYLYQLEALLEDENGGCADRICRRQALREVELKGISPDLPKQLFLNGERFIFKAVRYAVVQDGFGAETQSPVFGDLQELVRLGANCICVEGGEPTVQFIGLCERLGLLVGICRDVEEAMKKADGRAKATVISLCGQEGENIVMGERDIPAFRGSKNALFPMWDGADTPFGCPRMRPTSLYYKYLARWSREPFIYIVPESLKRLESGNYQVTCYSNAGRIALYSDGNFFEFQSGEEEFVFWEVPAKGPCIILSAEGGGCSTSFSVHKIFTNLSLIGDN